MFNWSATDLDGIDNDWIGYNCNKDDLYRNNDIGHIDLDL